MHVLNSIGNIVLSIFFITILSRPLTKTLTSLRRLRPRTPDERASVLDAGFDRIKFIHGMAGVLGGLMFILLSLWAASKVVLPAVVVANASRGNLGLFDDPAFEYLQQSALQHGIGIDLIAYVISIPVVALTGFAAVRWGVRRLLGAPRYAAGVGTTRGLLLRLYGSSWLYIPRVTFQILGLLGGAFVLLAAVLAVGMESLLIVCQFEDQLPWLIPAHWFNMLTYECSQALKEGYWNDTRPYEWFYLILFLASSAVIFIWRLRSIYRFFGARSLHPPLTGGGSAHNPDHTS